MVSVLIDEIKVGDKGSVSKTISESDVYNFAGVTGDFSWLHVDEVKAQKGPFGRRIVHGMLTIGLISAVVGTQMPGVGTIYASQNIKFVRPVFIGDTITAEVEIIEIMREKGLVRINATATNQHGELVLAGEGTVVPPKERY
ncbi:MAG: MaoC family dehydratase [Ignavibacteriales bacterium]